MSKNSQTVLKSRAKYINGGLEQCTVWAHPDEKSDIRKYASKKPKTKALLKKLKEG